MVSNAKLKVRYTGIKPLLMANNLAADPVSKFSQEIKKYQSKRKKTEADYLEIAKLQFLSALYLNEKRQLIIPQRMLKQNILEAARRVRKGPKIKEAVFIQDAALLNWNDGDFPAIDPEELFKDKPFVLETMEKTPNGFVRACYPKFEKWSLEFELIYLPDEIDKEDLIRIMEDAGYFKGLGRKRPEYGAFEVEILN